MTELLRALAHGRRPRPRALLWPLAAIVLLAGAGFAVVALAGAGPLAVLDPEPRTVVLVAREMTFVLEGGDEINPRLVASRGERLRFVLRNEDPGMAHDLAVPALDEKTRLLRQSGTSAELVVRLPDEAGELVYLCTSHARSMRGVIEVR